jgi:hypothetical protein
MMYEGVRAALAADDALESDHRKPPFRVRETPIGENRLLTSRPECSSAGMLFQVIDWSDLGKPPSTLAAAFDLRMIRYGPI